MNDETKPKRPRGNPNFGKKKVVDVSNVVGDQKSTGNSPAEDSMRESEVWLRLYSSILGQYNAPGVGPIKQAASYADIALSEYNSRYKK